MMKPLKFPKIIIGSIDDLLIQIFVHLPLKPLLRFKLVCKHWNSIISNPRFELMRCQQVHNNNRAVGLFFQTKVDRWNIGLPPPPLPPKLETRFVSFIDSRSSNPVHSLQTLGIFHSCNGLLVLEKKNTDHMFANPEYYVYNPTTKQITPPLLNDGDVIIKARLPRDRVVGMYLAFDPTKSPHYKVVCVWAINNNMREYEFQVYSSETRSWGGIRGGYNTNTSGYVNFENKGVYWNGAIHWAGYSDGKSVYFNPDDHDEPRVMPTPPIHRQRCSYFGESCGHLHYAGLVVGDDFLARRRGIYVYEMRRDYSEWFLKYKVVDDDYSRLFLPNKPNLFCVVRGGNKDSDSFLVWGTDGGETIRYDLVRNTWETIASYVAFRFRGHEPNLPNSFQYIESPCSV